MKFGTNIILKYNKMTYIKKNISPLFLLKSASILLLLLILSSCLQSNNKAVYEKNGVKVQFTTTQLGEYENEKFVLINDLKLAGVFVFIPDNKSVVIRHVDGQDELLKVIGTKKTTEGNYVFECNKQRVLFVSPINKSIVYSVEGNSAVFIFPIHENDIANLKAVTIKF
jgi:hypothetical protein